MDWRDNSQMKSGDLQKANYSLFSVCIHLESGFINIFLKKGLLRYFYLYLDDFFTG